MECPAVSYKTVSPVQLCNVVSALNANLITFRAMRVYLGCVELVAIREAAARHRKAQGKERGGVRLCYTIDELAQLTDASPSGVQRELSVLQKVGLLTFSPLCIAIAQTPLSFSKDLLHAIQGKRNVFRPIPAPRRFLRFLSCCQSPALVKTAIAYFLRGLSLDRTTGTINARGTVKLSWIASVMGISERAARYARGTLITLGWFTRDTASHQRKLNRDGAYFVLNVAWKPAPLQQQGCSTEELSPMKEPSQAEGTSQVEAVNLSPTPQPGNAPLPAQNCSRFAPLNKRLETPYGVKNQETPGSGVSLNLPPPKLSNIVSEDLESFSRTENLYWQAVNEGVLPHTEASALAFLGAAIRAKTARQGDPVRIFVGILRQHLWHHITHQQEERARRALHRFQEKDSMVFRIPPEERGKGVNYSCTAVLQQLGVDLSRLAA